MLLNVIDRLLSNNAERRNALLRARAARVGHGANAHAHLKAKLADPRRLRSRRELRLALGLLGQE
jgi:hypothetical protein